MKRIRLAARFTIGSFLLCFHLQAADFSATEDVWIRDIGPDTTFNADFLDVRRTVSGVVEVRYGLAQFDLSALAGQTVTGVELILDELGSDEGAGSSATLPIQTVAYSIGGPVPDLLATTWNTYQANLVAQESPFGSLGAYDLPVEGANRGDRSSIGNAADIALIQGIVDGSGTLTLALQPTSPGFSLASSFGDGELNGNNAILRILTIGDPVEPPSIVSVAGPAGPVPLGTEVALNVTATGTSPLTYQWLRNGQPVEGATGATSATLMLGPVSAAQAGEYTVVVTNSADSTTSDPIAVIVDTSRMAITAAEDVWIRDVAPDTTYNADWLDVRRTTEVRYGLAQFDLSALAGKAVTSAQLILDEIGAGGGSSSELPVQSVAFAIGSAGNVPDLLSMTWNSYQAGFEGQEAAAFSTLGAYDLPAPGTNGGDRSSVGSDADLSVLRGIANSSGTLTMVLKPAPGVSDIAASFGDGELLGSKNALLIVGISAPQPFEITDVRRNATTGDVTLTWNSVPGRTYIIHHSSNLAGDPRAWPDLDDDWPSGGAQTSFTDQAAGGSPGRFYSIEEN